MEIFLTAVTSFIIFMLACKQYRDFRRNVRPDEERVRYVFYLDLLLVFDIICNSLNGKDAFVGMPFIVMLATTAVYLLSNSLLDVDRLKWLVLSVISAEMLLGFWFIFSRYEVLPQISEDFYLIATSLLSFIIAFYMIYGVFLRLKNIKLLMSSGSVWTSLSLSVDLVYLSLILLFAMAQILSNLYFESAGVVSAIVFTLLYVSFYVALGIRILNVSVFVVMTEHERKIVESMKMANVDSRADSAGSTVLYKNIYDRVVEYFTESKPYLNSNLTINDVVEVVFSNKLYISRAISQFTGRNFCQFVNYYRVVHAIELFRSDVNLKVQELANRSGFNSHVSFGMAFRLYMGEKPGDWCRRERFRLEKQKK